MKFELTSEKLFTLLSRALEKGNHERCVRIFYDVAKIVHYRQQRLNKPQLIMKEITSALVLADFYHTYTYRFEASGELASNFGHFSEERAVEYFEHFVLGSLTDCYGRMIRIEDSGLRSIYKEKYSGKHILAPENYEAVRGKRLPWIRHVLKNSKSIYQVDELVGGKFRRTYLYTSIASVPVKGTIDLAYFIVIVSEDSNGNLWFVTAYHIQSHNRFLSRIEPTIPFTGK